MSRRKGVKQPFSDRRDGLRSTRRSKGARKTAWVGLPVRSYMMCAVNEMVRSASRCLAMSMYQGCCVTPAYLALASFS